MRRNTKRLGAEGVNHFRGAASRSRSDRPPLNAEGADFFRRLIGCFGLSRSDLAMRLGCDARALQALEQGHGEGLPPWPETVRIVTALTAPLGLDPRPALELAGRVWSAGEPGDDPRERPVRGGPRAVSRAAFGARTVMASARSSWTAWRPRLFRPAWRYVFVIALPLLLTAYVAQPAALDAAASVSSGPLAGMVREAKAFASGLFGSRQDGMRVIVVDDPRSRRADKLRPRPR